MAHPEIEYDPPPPPPTQNVQAYVVAGSALLFIGVGVMDLIAAFVADCMNALNLALGVVELFAGLLLLWWLLSWWLPRCRRAVAEHEAQLFAFQERVEKRYAAIKAGTAEPRPPDRHVT
jgi:hypothetical protein